MNEPSTPADLQSPGPLLPPPPPGSQPVPPGSPAPTAYAAAPDPSAYGVVPGHLSPRPAGHGLAIGALVVAILSMIVAFGAVVTVIAVGTAGSAGRSVLDVGDPSEMPPEFSGSPDYSPPTGQVSLDDGAVTGGALTAEVEKTLQGYWGSTTVSCPEVDTVAAGVVTVCHGNLYDEGMAVVVVFEDDDGRFTIVPV